MAEWYPILQNRGTSRGGVFYRILTHCNASHSHYANESRKSRLAAKKLNCTLSFRRKSREITIKHVTESELRRDWPRDQLARSVLALPSNDGVSTDLAKKGTPTTLARTARRTALLRIITATQTARTTTKIPTAPPASRSANPARNELTIRERRPQQRQFHWWGGQGDVHCSRGTVGVVSNWKRTQAVQVSVVPMERDCSELHCIETNDGMIMEGLFVNLVPREIATREHERARARWCGLERMRDDTILSVMTVLMRIMNKGKMMKC